VQQNPPENAEARRFCSAPGKARHATVEAPFANATSSPASSSTTKQDRCRRSPNVSRPQIAGWFRADAPAPDIIRGRVWNAKRMASRRSHECD
jgi:hypothetical protein